MRYPRDGTGASFTPPADARRGVESGAVLILGGI